MPEFEQRKRKTMSQQELYEEYHNNNTPRKSSAVNAKNKSGKSSSVRKNTSHRENPPISAERKRMQEELSKKQAAAKKSKTYTGKTSGKSPKRSASSSRSSLSRSPSNSKHSRSSADVSARSSSSGSNRKKKKSGRYTLYYILIGILAVVALTVLSTTVLFNIGVFVVSGETVYSEEEIIEACGIKIGDNLLRINTGKAEENIVSNLVYIESAEVRRGFPNRLTLTVEPAKPVVAFAYGGEYYVISENKRLLEIADTPLDCPVIKGVEIMMRPTEDKNTEETTDGADADNAAASSAKETVLTSENGITLEGGAEKIEIGVVLGDDAAERIKLALSIVGLMKENGLDEEYEVNIADTLDVQINYGGHIEIDLGTTASLDEKIYNASRVIEEDIADNEKCILNLTNPSRAVKRPIYDNGEDINNASDTEINRETQAEEDGTEEPETENPEN